MAEQSHTKKGRDLMTRCGYKAGGHLGRAGMEEIADKAVHEHEAHDHPGKPRTKLASGGAVDGYASGGNATKAKRGKPGTKINIIVAGGGQPGAGGPPPGAMMPPPHPPMPMPAPPAAAPPPMAGGIPPQRPPGLKTGGSVKYADEHMPDQDAKVHGIVGSKAPMRPQQGRHHGIED